MKVVKRPLKPPLPDDDDDDDAIDELVTDAEQCNALKKSWAV